MLILSIILLVLVISLFSFQQWIIFKKDELFHSESKIVRELLAENKLLKAQLKQK